MTSSSAGTASRRPRSPHNQTLSEQRAKAVADYLTSKVPSLNVQSSGKGESEPVASETNADGSVNEAGKAANRHVDVRWG